MNVLSYSNSEMKEKVTFNELFLIQIINKIIV